jgi:hypothetical protein
MRAREIAYNELDTSLACGLCPCCGVGSPFAYACMACFQDTAEIPQGRTRSEVREWFYNRGVQLRADGRMPALKTVADAHDKCAMIWTAAMWNENGTLFGWCCGGLGPRSESPQDYDTIRSVKGESSYIGPVQLATDPPHAPAKYPHFGQLKTPALAKQPEPRTGSCCALAWCAKPKPEHTNEESVRCASYLTEREGIIGQYDKYMRELKVPKPMPGETCGDIGSWAAHAARRREDAMGALEARFRALTFVPTKE